MNERFRKPTPTELVEFAIVFNEGKIDRELLSTMVGFCNIVIDRLYDKGDILLKSKREKELETKNK